MKKTVIAVLAGILLLTAAVLASYRFGISHAINDSEYWVLEFSDHAPYDYTVHVLIDGEWYEHGIYVG